MNASSQRLSYPLIGLAVIAAITAFRIIALYLNNTNLFFDEAQYWTWSLAPAAGYYSKPPLIAFIINLSTGVCGDSEFCIRLPSALIHGLSSAAVMLAATRLYDVRTGVWSGILFLTIPGVSFSSYIVSTDVPLLFCWAVALYAFVGLLKDRTWFFAVLMGLALGVGLNAKYAMAYFAVCMFLYLIFTPQYRSLLRDLKLWAALLIGLAFCLPNFYWNLNNGLSTFFHTVDNAKLEAARASLLDSLGIVAALFAIVGPFLFAIYLWIAVRAVKVRLGESERLLLAFSLPVLFLLLFMTVFLRANANWAAPSFVAVTILATATLLSGDRKKWIDYSLILNMVVIVFLAGAFWGAGKVPLPGRAEPFRRVLGWDTVGTETQQKLQEAQQAGKPFGSVLTIRRSMTAELLYYMREDKTPVYAWHASGRPLDHYQLTRPFRKGATEPVLLVSFFKDPGFITGLFETSQTLGTATIKPGRARPRTLYFHSLSGFRGYEAKPRK